MVSSRCLEIYLETKLWYSGKFVTCLARSVSYSEQIVFLKEKWLTQKVKGEAGEKFTTEEIFLSRQSVLVVRKSLSRKFTIRHCSRKKFIIRKVRRQRKCSTMKRLVHQKLCLAKKTNHEIYCPSGESLLCIKQKQFVVLKDLQLEKIY